MRSASPLRRAISIPMRRNEVLHDSPLEGAGFEPSVPRGHVEDAPWNFDVVHRGWHNSHASSAHPTKRIVSLCCAPGISRKRSTSAGDEFGERLLRLGASDDMRRVMPLFAPLRSPALRARVGTSPAYR